MGYEQGDPIFEAYITESSQLIEQLEEMILLCENASGFPEEMVQEIFRIMHTVKGSSSMMQFHNIAALAHALEDLFSYLLNHPFRPAGWSELSDVMLEGVDFAKVELHKLTHGEPADGDPAAIVRKVERLLEALEEGPGADGLRPDADGENTVRLNRFSARLVFTDDCEMENVRAYQVIYHLKEMLEEYWHFPDNLLDDPDACGLIRNQGFQIFMKTYRNYGEIHSFLSKTSYLKELELTAAHRREVQDGPGETTVPREESETRDAPEREEKQEDWMMPPAENQTDKRILHQTGTYQGKTINVNVVKLDELMDLVGELVIIEAMVTQNPDIAGSHLEHFQKVSRQLHKITKDIQDKVMEIRMVPLATTFQRMHRVVRDMGKKLGKNVRLQLIGEETEVDKNIIEHISDPLMHLVRNAIDHGLETPEEREAAGKPAAGTLTLEAQNNGGEVLIHVRDDGRGLDKQKILDKAKANQLLFKPEAELTDKDIFQMIFLPGFSTKEQITEYSGRGVGMDVVVQNIAAVGGTIGVASEPGEGTVFTIKIPLTLAIVDGMIIRVGEEKYTLPTTSIKESFRPQAGQIITDPDGNEMIIVRGEGYPILRIHELFHVSADTTRIEEGILILAEHEGRGICIFVDELVGQQQVVVKALPTYMIAECSKLEGISGCTLLGDGSISLILDVQGLSGMKQ